VNPEPCHRSPKCPSRQQIDGMSQQLMVEWPEGDAIRHPGAKYLLVALP
jgi:hypothetical protein